MSFNISINIKPDEILSNHNIDEQCWLFAASRFHDMSEPYVPFADGTLQNTAQVSGSGNVATVTYVQPYAHYQYEGRTYGPNVFFEGIGWRSLAPKGGKYMTGGSLTYGNGPLRGAHWDKRFLADKKQDWLQAIADYVGGRVV